MNCPVCQTEIKDGQLYCEKCGYEIRIVPDFEAELENNIMENMSGVINELMPEEDEDPVSEPAEAEEIEKMEEIEEFDFEEDRPSLLRYLFRYFKNHMKICSAALCLIILLIAAAVFIIVQNNLKNTYDYQYEQALACAQKEKYAEAIDYLYEAIRLESNHPEARILIADYKVKLGEYSEAELLYRDLFQYADCAQEAYEKYIALLEQEERYLDICNQLAGCEIESVRSEYNQYLALPPVFSVPEGEYEDVQILKISANTNGIVYYTTDGSTPDESAHVYTGPIMLESGAYEIKAVFINEYGRVSDVFSAEYMIHVEIPNMPVVTPDGGDYQVPEYISVEIPKGCTVYYTVDAGMPDQTSLTYSRQICMPLGNATFRFVSYNSDNVASEVNQVEYHLYLDNPRFSGYQAMLITASGLTERGVLLNMNGEVSGDSGRFSYKATAAFVYEGEIYYLMTEYYTDTSGNTYSTQTKYAVSVSYGILYKTSVDSNGQYSVSEFEAPAIP